MRNTLPALPSNYTVEIDEVQSLLRKVKLNKAGGPDGISHRILRELADFFGSSSCGNN